MQAAHRKHMQRAAFAKRCHQRIRIARRLTNHHRADHHRFTRVFLKASRHTLAECMANPRAPCGMPRHNCFIEHARRLKDRRHILISQPFGAIKFTGISRLWKRLEIAYRLQHRSRHMHLSPALPQHFRALTWPGNDAGFCLPKSLAASAILQQAHTQIRASRIRHHALKILPPILPPHQYTRRDGRTQKPSQAPTPCSAPSANQTRRQNHRNQKPKTSLSCKHAGHRRHGGRKQRPSTDALIQPRAHAGEDQAHDGKNLGTSCDTASTGIASQVWLIPIRRSIA